MVQGLQSELLSAMSYSSGSGSLSTLTALGITTNSDGTLSVNSSTLNSAIETNSAAVSTFFQGTGSNGFASSLNSVLNTYTDSTGGAFTVDLRSIANEDAELTDQTDTLEIYLSSQQTLLTTKYNEIDAAIQSLPQKIKQIDALLNPSSSDSSS